MNTGEIIRELVEKWSAKVERPTYAPHYQPRLNPWWERAACECIRRGHFWLIPTRDRSGPYLLRMWLSPPVKSQRDSVDRWDSQDSLILHYFFRGDDDAALHDHPWDFTTRVLVGGYVEHLPPADWPICSDRGPAWDRNRVWRLAGTTVSHQASDLHCVGETMPGTFTLVQMGAACRKWGFHPEGRPWIDADDYLHRSPTLPASRAVMA